MANYQLLQGKTVYVLGISSVIIEPSVGGSYKTYKDTGGYYSWRGESLDLGLSAEMNTSISFFSTYQIQNRDFYRRDFNQYSDQLHTLSGGASQLLSDSFRAQIIMHYIFYMTEDDTTIGRYTVSFSLSSQFSFFDDFRPSPLLPGDLPDALLTDSVTSSCSGSSCTVTL